ncbi:hypothetical protein FTX61_07680 [Nitriliruptoraceae bacterium ZYF776]|nr:hypothetical protein [Profundirhabdus halotolerans]
MRARNITLLVCSVGLLMLLPGASSAAPEDEDPCPRFRPTCTNASRGGVEIGARSGGEGASPVAGDPHGRGGEARRPGGRPPRRVGRCELGAAPGSPDDPTRPGQYRGRCTWADDIHAFAPIPDSEPGEPDDTPDLAGMVDEAFASITPGTPQLITSPPADPGAVTGLPIYLAVDGDQLDTATATVTAGDWSVTGTIEPAGLHIDPGDGTDPFVCDGFGTVWQHGDRPGDGDCTHTYTDLPDGGTVEVTVHLTYRATATIAGPEGTTTDDLGTLEGPTTTLTLPVREHRAVRTN